MSIDGNTVFKCADADGQLSGWAVKAEGGRLHRQDHGRRGPVATGVTRSRASQAIKNTPRTPGLGNKIDSKPQHFYPFQYAEKSTERPFELVKREPTEDFEIQAITGATYSSQYVMDIVNDVIVRIRPQLTETGSAAPSAARPTNTAK